MSITIQYVPPTNPEDATPLCKCGHPKNEHEEPFGCLDGYCGCIQFLLKRNGEAITPIPILEEELED